jgi:hypothetical protein
VSILSSLLAIGWQPEIRGLSIVVISVVVFCGSVYLLLATNLGARLGFLVAMAGLMGWMTMMGVIWMFYGIGLQGKSPSWKYKDIIVSREKLDEAKDKIARDTRIPDNTTEGARVNGWLLLPKDNPGRGQAVASADEILQIEAKVLKSGDYEALAVYDYGGEAWPKYTKSNVSIGGRKFGDWKIDFIAFFHKPHYALVQVKPVVKQATEPGKAPPRPVVDETAPDYFVLMERDLGAKRRPAFLITLASALMFAALCHVLHRRERILEDNRALPAEPVGV